MANELIPVVNNALDLTGKVTSLITRSRETKVIDKAKLEWLKDQTNKILVEARTYHAKEIVCANIEQLAKTQETIDMYENQGKLHGRALDMAMEQLEDLNNILRDNLRDYKNRELRG